MNMLWVNNAAWLQENSWMCWQSYTTACIIASLGDVDDMLRQIMPSNAMIWNRIAAIFEHPFCEISSNLALHTEGVLAICILISREKRVC